MNILHAVCCEILFVGATFKKRCNSIDVDDYLNMAIENI